MVCPPVTSEAGARRPRSISNFGGLCQTRKTPTLHLLLFSPKQIFTGKLPVLRFEKTGFYRPR
jgi:hypothetical protein